MQTQIIKNGFQVQNLHLHYSQKKQLVHAINGMSLNITSGESVAITGPSGCGKSSLLALLGGLQRPNSGEVLFDGHSLITMSDKQLSNFRAESIGFVFQQFCLLPHLSLLDNVLLSVDHLPSAQFEERARLLLSRVNLESEMLRFPHEVSGGQAQRAAIARALLRQPRFILADEPTGALDEDTAEVILNLLLELTCDGCGLIIVTHSESIAARLPRRIRLMSGKVVADTRQDQNAAA